MSKDFVEIQAEVMSGMGALGAESPEVMNAFMGLHGAATADGALPKRIKELMALAIAITVRCDGCIAFHVKEAVDAGASRDEIIETIGVAIVMGGGPSVVYGSEARDALDQFTAG
ncbi:MAG: carboxymuconolactone decarboxylase family protein [Ilumatobacter sp.]|nr:carboxymuconolactone decarboxylase family protein [Ilumatobacter sp.]